MIFPQSKKGSGAVVWIGVASLVFWCNQAAIGGPPSSLAKEMLQTTYREEFYLTAAPKEVWQALSEEFKLIPHTRVLVSEPDDLVLSWVELSEPSAPALKSTPKPTSTPSGRPGAPTPTTSERKNALLAVDAARLKEIEMAEVGDDRVAVTTVMINVAPKGAMVRFRRIYYGSHTQPRIAHSTGVYENWLATQLSRRLGTQTVINPN